LRDTDAHVRKTAVWASELFIQQQDADVISRLGNLTTDSSADVRIQLMLSLRSSNNVKAQQITTQLLTSDSTNELMRFSYKMFEDAKVRAETELARLKNLSPADRALVSKGAVRYKQLCANCHGADGKGI
jgi:cytochrome c